MWWSERGSDGLWEPEEMMRVLGVGIELAEGLGIPGGVGGYNHRCWVDPEGVRAGIARKAGEA